MLLSLLALAPYIAIDLLYVVTGVLVYLWLRETPVPPHIGIGMVIVGLAGIASHSLSFYYFIYRRPHSFSEALWANTITSIVSMAAIIVFLATALYTASRARTACRAG